MRGETKGTPAPTPCSTRKTKETLVNNYPAPTPTPQEKPADDQDPVKVFTEEVRLPLVAFDDYGYFDPTLGLDDVLVIEAGVQQQVRSVRHTPASILLVLDVDAQITVGKKTEATKAIAKRLLSRVREGDEVAVLQFGNGVEVMQDWTTA